MIEEYRQFVESKQHSSIDQGIEPIRIPDTMFDFQKHVTEYAIRKGRAALFLDTGLGKTFVSLVIADNYAQSTRKPVLIITPLAVAYQFVDEAKKFGIDGVKYDKTGTSDARIVVTNYQQLDKQDASKFDCVILDESSILKNFDGQLKKQIIQFLKRVQYRFLCTATPSPNDYTELGNSSEALGEMGHVDMLTKFFTNQVKSVDLRHSGAKWILKPHAVKAFWQWVSSWSISMRNPSDFGFSDKHHTLPGLHEIETVVESYNPLVVNDQPFLFAVDAVNFSELRSEVRNTIIERCEEAVQKATKYDHSVYWVNLNDESSLIAKLDSDAVEIKGAMSLDQKEEILKSFADGEISRLITKPKITGFGLNWQHCNHTVFFPTYSFEQYYQAIRRFWRFGQTSDVTVDLIISQGQRKVMRSLREKRTHAEEMFAHLVGHTSKSHQARYRDVAPITRPMFL